MSLASLQATAVPLKFSVATPAAGADWSLTVPANEVYRLESVFFKLVTSAAVASRFPRLVITDAAGNIVAQSAQQFSIPASQTVFYGATRLGPQATTAPNGGPMLMSTPDLWVPGGFIIKTATINVDVADQYSLITGMVSAATTTL